MIFRDEMNKYRQGIPQEEVDFIKNCIIRSNALRFETNEALNSMISTMSKYDLRNDYIKDEEAIINGMTPMEHKIIVEKYIDPSKMVWLVVGDGASQMQKLDDLGFGKPQLIKR
jgi:zinc protease